MVMAAADITSLLVFPTDAFFIDVSHSFVVLLRWRDDRTVTLFVRSHVVVR